MKFFLKSFLFLILCGCQKNIEKDKKSVALKVLFEPTDKTLNDKEIDELSDKIILAAKSLGGSLRSQ